MRKAILCLGYLDVIPEITTDVIGVDHGAELLAQHQIPMVYAIGDFDSTTSLESVEKYAKEIVKLPAMKNETDCEAACLWALQHYDHLDVYGGLGGRMDHEYANLALLMHRKYPMTLYNKNNRMYRLDSGKHIIEKLGYTYISFFPLQPTEITLSGVKYPLSKQKIDMQDIYLVSNEIVNDCMQLEITGEVLVIQSRDM